MEWGIWLSLFLLSTPAFFFSPSCDCCLGFDCGVCSVSTQTPKMVQAVVSGMANSGSPTCSGVQCTSLDGTHEMMQVSAGSPCYWLLNVTQVCGLSGTATVELQLAGSPFNNATGQVLWGSGPSVYSSTFVSSATGWDDCHSWSAFDLPYSGGSTTYCTGASATFKLTTP